MTNMNETNTPRIRGSAKRQRHSPQNARDNASVRKENDCSDADVDDDEPCSVFTRLNREERRQEMASKERPKRDPNHSVLPESPQVLEWNLAAPHIPLAAEQDMLKVILRWGAKERGMLKSQPAFRLRDIQRRCHRNGMHISQACSLRRHHMALLNPTKSKPALGLGNNEQIRQSAAVFEQAIEVFLQKRDIPYADETEQKEVFYQENPEGRLQGTPDFKMKRPVLLRVYAVPYIPRGNDKNKRRTKRPPKRLILERTIHWIEAKMFYGASTIPHDDRSAVGSILSKMSKYVDLFGSGAIVFMNGCGEQLAAELDAIGVTALACFGNDIDLSEVWRDQRTWCADENGNILP